MKRDTNHNLQLRQTVIYARVSSKEQEKEGFSIPAQLKLLRNYAQDHGFTVIKEYVDVETAKKAGRLGFGKMLEYLRGHPATCKTVLVEKTDRLYRNLKDWVTLDELDLEIHLVKEGALISNGSRSSEKFMHGIKVLMAKNYIDNLSEETRKGMVQKAEEGILPTHAPLGYRNVMGPNGKRVIEVHPDEAPLIRKVFEWYASGNYSLHDVNRMAREAGLAYRKSGNPLHLSNIDHILRNPIYYGDFFWAKKLYRGTHEPIITRELWEAVQTVRKGRHKALKRGGKERWAFQGLLTCGHCGCALTAEKRKGKYVYYHCTGHRGKCPEKYVREETLAAQFGDYLKNLQLDDDVVAWLKDALTASHDDEMRFHNESIEALQSQYTRLQARIDRMYEDKLDGIIAAAAYESKSAAWRTEQSEITHKIEAHQRANANYLDHGVKLLELAQKAYVLYQRQAVSEKRKLLNFVFSNSTFKDGRVQPNFRKPFDSLMESNIAYQKQKATDGKIHDLRPTWGG